MNGQTRPRLRRLLFSSLAALALVATLGATHASASTGAASGDVGTQTHTAIPGIDVSHWQGSINWTSVRNAGVQWAYIKATEGTSYKDPRWGTNYTNAYYAGVIRGSYHFARPSYSSGYTQANFFASNGGAWSRDNRTLPGALDLEAGCHGLSQSAMRSWILSFYNQYKARTSRDVVIYTTASWWNSCTGYWTGMWNKSPLWVAHWGVSSPTLPYGWRQYSTYTMWQYTDCRSVSGISGCVDGDRFHGDRSRLLALANNT